jgi:hypothetical protein
MTEAELEAEIALVTTAISNILKTGQKYEINSGQSKRVFEAADLDKLRNYRTELRIELQSLQGSSGLVLGF